MSVTGVGSRDSDSMAAQVQHLHALKVLAATTQAVSVDPTYTGDSGTGGAVSPLPGPSAGTHAPDSYRNDMAALFDAVNSGDMSAARSALAKVVEDGKAFYGPNGKAPKSNSPVARDFAALAQAIQSGDAAGAQNALKTLQSDFAAHRGQHHHHHRGGVAIGAASPAPGITQAASPPATNSAGGDKDHDGDRS